MEMYKVGFQDFSIFTEFLQTTQEILIFVNLIFLTMTAFLAFTFHKARIVFTVFVCDLEN